ncbi:phenylalanine--tRNA ligase subunit beta [Ferruginibacter lapsinanis]|uniref:phenylalanine--tRNA ligase subunit beta n=1 Tax=Ferruginibacter lapsinanis TaxID=563172 RepID=UPI001E495634|nr:phenylalanine--tRNA ligase subunit beta [Ferruginibacter lapsinanis]UEG50368.1 phenylalanine--tRNA ligase subunit beta [Ferruginibacter lapsinanis]
MTISYNWLSEYLPEKIEPEKLSKILTSIGLEVESMEKYEEMKGGLEGLVIGEVLTCEKHPDADKLSITTVSIGGDAPLQIVCGAPNVAAGQKVVVATVGATIYPLTGDPMTMKKAKIRGVESFGMICAEDEIGLSESHAGIMVLPAATKTGTPAAEYFKPYNDVVFEIGLTPNRMDAMSHLGVAKDVCAYLWHHNKKEVSVKSPYKNSFKADNQLLPIEVKIDNATACLRYAGISIQGVTIAESPKWLQQKIKTIGLRPINNIVDITNFILHETGQPLHAFDADQIIGNKIIVKNLPEGTSFLTLDDKERKLSAEDLMICNAEEPMCIGGVYGGAKSGVTAITKNIFLESAWFNPITIRKTSFRHGLRTDAATRFEKGVDIGNTVNVLKRAAEMIKEIAGGQFASNIIDVYPAPKQKTEVAIKYHYLKKLSGKNYHGDTIKNILTALGFEILKEGQDDIRIAVPFNKPDVSIPADIVEEIMRIDGLDNVEIPTAITISPSVETLAHEASYKEKTANYLIGLGFNEIFTNSITNAAYYSEEVLQTTVKMINSLSAELNVMRPSMMETGLESVAYNLNRRNTDLQFFEFGKTYTTSATGKYFEQQHLSIYITGKKTADSWKGKGDKADIYFAKAVVEKTIQLLGLTISSYNNAESNTSLDSSLQVKVKNEIVATIGIVNKKTADRFDIKQPVLYADIDWDKLIALNKKVKIEYTEIAKYPLVQRDLAIVVNKSVKYEDVEKATYGARVNKLRSVNLFDIFESDKLGADKKSLAVSFTFLDEEKTLTDKEIDAMMGKIIVSYEKELSAEIRK